MSLDEQPKLKTHFTDSIFYEIELTAKYCTMLGTQVFEKFNTGIPVKEFTTLDTILCNPGICQRDLAKLILVDRANTGKILDSLEKKGFIERKLAVKNNRPVKIAELTEAGRKKTEEVTALVRPHMETVRKKIQNTDLSKVTSLLKELREDLKDTIEIQI